MNLAFHGFVSGHLAELVDLWVESWTEVYANIDFEARRGWFVDHVTAWTDRGALCRVAIDRETGNMAGFILLDPEKGHLDQICVHRDLKGQGIAQELLAEARRLSPSQLTLDVNLMNTRAIRFYERQGFQRTGTGVNPHSGLPIAHYRWQP